MINKPIAAKTLPRTLLAYLSTSGCSGYFENGILQLLFIFLIWPIMLQSISDADGGNVGSIFSRYNVRNLMESYPFLSIIKIHIAKRIVMELSSIFICA